MHDPLILGILNVTPDSFSDGGRFHALDAALKHAEQLADQGADYLDIGGESTRPGSLPVSEQEELDRTIPVLEAIARRIPVRLSIDTRKAAVAEAAVNAGATLINDISAGEDPAMADVAARSSVNVLLMHMRGNPTTMQVAPEYPSGVVEEVTEFFTERVAKFVTAGVAKAQIWIDPGIGFGKRLEHNLTLMRGLGNFLPLADRVAIGTSRKSFLAMLLNLPTLPILEREAGTLTTCLWALQKGVSVFRVHAVGDCRRAVDTWRALEGTHAANR